MNKKLGIFIPRTSFYMWFIFLLIIIIAILDYRLAVPCAMIFIVIFVHNYRSNYIRQKEIKNYIENLTLNIDSASKDTLLNFPLPLVVVELDGTIVWFNSISRNIFGDEKLFEKKIDSLLADLKPDRLIKKSTNISLNVEINYRHYRVLGNYVKTSAKSNMTSYIMLLYFIDITETERLKEIYRNEKTEAGIIVFDNYDELMQSMENPGPPQLLAEIEKRITGWMGFTDGILKKFERDKYLFIFEFRHLKELKKRKFEILDDVKEIKMGNKIPVTLSIGFGINEDNLSDNFNAAAAAIDIALARGGDQVVIKDRDTLSFFGGKSRELEKRTRVKARVVAYALRELVDQSENVLIMGHENGDVDSLGASLGLYRIVVSRNKNAHIVLNRSNSSIEVLVKKIRNNPGYEGVLLEGSEALEEITDRTLLVVADTHRPALTEYPELLKKVRQVVVIDHHRRGAEFIHDPVLIYQETYASSTCELVTELLQYVDEKIKLTTLEVQALYAGIVVDTKNFTFKTGVRTFEAASFLRKKGVDTVSVKQLFRNDIKIYRIISDIVKNSEVFQDKIAISSVPGNVKNPVLIAAKAADELVMLSDIEAAFVMCENENEISISGRSLGDINVQAVLEKLGGGGHLTVAGAQMKDTAMMEAREKLKYAIISYIEESNIKDKK